ncbi:histidinol-phosphate transaminase [Desulfonema ishimotonii]|uniref:Histidinol-phosphate aminotransferase n=1 Tax=Desulfonema ishimotonii TaxID=45657 RepID=A0A401FRC9_9BACT|nr:histidinol-phosphate transaminase [Desulfonema ishimotonii]GBC59522.1 histidinol-phosphate transaminase [Desulfonema ishimotonii]
MNLSVPDYIAAIKPYVPGKPLEELEREYGITDSVKLASNENPLGPSPMAVAAIREAINTLHRYPDGSAFHLVRKLAAHLGVLPENIVLGNGSDEIIGMLAQVFLRPGDEVIIPRPSFLMYDISVQCTGATGVYLPLRDLGIDPEDIRQAITPRTRMIFICNPNNPTGTIITQEAFDRLLNDIPPGIIVVVDEAYIEFVRDARCLHSTGCAVSDRPVVTLRTFSKAYGLAGLRVGYGITTAEIANLLNRVRMPFNTSIPAQAGACAALEDTAFLEKTIRTVHEGIDFLYAALDDMGVRYFPTQSNFFLIDVKRDAGEVFEHMLREGSLSAPWSPTASPNISGSMPGLMRKTCALPKR